MPLRHHLQIGFAIEQLRAFLFLPFHLLECQIVVFGIVLDGFDAFHNMRYPDLGGLMNS